MVKLIIDDREVSVKEGTSILDAAKKLGIHIPTLCYLKDINEVGACRVCVVEVEGQDRLVASCNTPVQDGMVVRTNTKRVMDTRKMNVELILARHNTSCTSCTRDGNCSLQEVSKELNIVGTQFEEKYAANKWNPFYPLQRDAGKCIQCLRCINVCNEIQGMHVWDIIGTGSRTKVGVREGKDFKDVNCTICGQCITHCPVGALSERDDTQKVIDAVADPEKIVVVQAAPAIRAAFAQATGITEAQATEKRMAAAIKAIGADYVFDTNFAADLTIMEEGSELVQYLGKRKNKLPMFTSCCPGWVRFMKLEYPDMVKNLSSAKSPQQMFGAVAKSYFAKKIGVDPEKIFCVSIMPCTAKKYECAVKEVSSAADRDVDVVLTTREFGRMLRGIDVAALKEIEFDSPLGSGTGAAVIFGATGGVMEAALRSAYFLVTGKNPSAEAFTEVRADGADEFGVKTWREAEFKINDLVLHVAVASGLANTRALMEAIRKGQVQYDFVEIMACPGGCAGGGGQPIADGCELAGTRSKKLYKIDKANKLRFSHENPDVLELYRDYLKKPLSTKAHHLLHTDQNTWEL